MITDTPFIHILYSRCEIFLFSCYPHLFSLCLYFNNLFLVMKVTKWLFCNFCMLHFCYFVTFYALSTIPFIFICYINNFFCPATAIGSFLRTHGDTKKHFSRILWYKKSLFISLYKRRKRLIFRGTTRLHPTLPARCSHFSSITGSTRFCLCDLQ